MFSVQANPNDFGAQVGGALEKSGGQLQETGQKAMDLATHLGDIYNDSSARDGVVAASKEVGNAELQYRQNRGLNAPAAYKTFQDTVQSITDKYTQNMPTNGAQKLFRDQFSREAAYSIKNAGAWAADQTEQAQFTSLGASIDNKVNQFAMAGSDVQRRSELASGIRDDALQLAHFKGLDEQSADMLVSKSIGAGYSSLIKSAAQTNPDMANQLFDEATNNGFTVNRNGNDIKVPFLDAAQAAQVRSEMFGEYRKQEADALQASRIYAAQGANFDQNRLVSSMQRVGRSDDYINAEVSRLKELQGKATESNGQYNLNQTIQSDMQNAMNGFPVIGEYPQSALQAAYPNDPQKQQQTLQTVQNMHTVAGFAGSFQTKTPQQIYSDLNQYGMAAQDHAANAINWTMQHEGGYVSNDSGKGPTNFGINSEANPGIDVVNLTKDQAAQILHNKYWNGIGADNMSPAMAQVAFDSAVNMGIGKTKTLLAQAGDDPQKLIDLRRQEYQRLADANPEKYGQYLSSWNNRLDDLQKSIGSTGQENTQLYGMMKSSADQYVQKLYQDPSGTIVGYDQHLTALLNQGLQDPSKLGQFADASLARQKLLGVPDNLQTALPASVATGIANTIMSNPAGAPDTINKLAQQTGKNWPDVYHSLVTRGNLSPAMQSVAQLSESTDTLKDASLLSQWYGDDTKGKLTSKLLGEKSENDIKKTILSDSSVTQLTQSLINSGAPKARVEGAINSIQSLAFAKSYYEKDPNAAQNAVQAFTSRYAFIPNGGARVPANKADAVKQNVQQTISNISLLAVTPPEYSTGRHGLPTPQEYYNWVKAKPTWVTSPNEDALWLKDPMDKLVLGKDGKPVSVPFNAVAQQNSELSVMNKLISEE